ncbi:Pathogenesis-related thaumatin superfamily protein [Abeliophyllum distichum]|uniref:Pathogenesis-related thaumatin superfamily protein n=1 Tax=Abeliophyllum distichum TaxID=126358 RepID=A0ABD1PBN6_9LAMI
MALFWHLSFVLVWNFLGANAAVFTLQNRCPYTIWPATLPGSGKPVLVNGGFQLGAAQATTIAAPAGWSGRLWARTGCTFDQSGRGRCTTGDCGSVLQCNGAGGTPPVSLAEFTLNSPQDFYDVSLVDGYNLPISIDPSGGSGGCGAVHCVSDLNRACPPELAVAGESGVTVACKSACLAFNQPQYCCTGAFNSPQTCKPTNYSQIFKQACPTAYSYPFDDVTSTFTCTGANYLITFC